MRHQRTLATATLLATMLAGCTNAQPTSTAQSIPTPQPTATSTSEPGSSPTTASTAGGTITADDLPDWPATYTGSRTGPFFKAGVELKLHG